MHRDAHRIVLPTLFGYATLLRASDLTHPFAGRTRRVDTVLPPDLTTDELHAFHVQLLRSPAHRRSPRTAATAVGRRRLLGHAVDVRTTGASALSSATAAATPLDVASAALVRAMRRACDARLGETQEALARQLVWCGIHAARDHEVAQVLHAAAALRNLTVIGTSGTTTTEALDQA
ncbi:hypothetical protein JN535_00010 [Cellulosimicrobium cellulans]|uniref:hypothetical protein n=1 Tax=Cellulosimicrobium cellulans TaxID=1710 RepID=UPI001965E6F7|nr:hypothetical protein [Cellulosimicrobium cellulans]MBN0038556.1 hypothetical protein [Cellulosimicrobium cellulans]